MGLNKSTIIDRIVDAGVPRQHANTAVNICFDAIVRSVATGPGKITITGLGTFERVHRAARKGRAPRTGESVDIPARMGVSFTAADTFKQYTADPSTMPDSGLVGCRRPTTGN